MGALLRAEHPISASRYIYIVEFQKVQVGWIQVVAEDEDEAQALAMDRYRQKGFEAIEWSKDVSVFINDVSALYQIY